MPDGNTDYGFDWANVRVLRLLQVTAKRVTYRAVRVASQRHVAEVYVSEARGKIRVYVDGVEWGPRG